MGDIAMDLLVRFFRHIVPIGLIASLGIFSISALGGSDQSRIKGFGVDLAQNMPVSSESVESSLSNIQAAGVTYVRIQLDWREIETSPDTYNWNQVRPLDLIINSAYSRGITIVAVLSGGPVYLGNNGALIDQSAFGDRWEKFVSAAVQHYGEMIDYWEIGEGINTAASQAEMLLPVSPGASLQPDPAFYTKLLRSASKIINKVDSNDEVWIGSLVNPSSGYCAVNPLTFLLEIHGARGWNSADAISYQPDWGANAPENPTASVPSCSSTVTTNTASLASDVHSVQELARQLGGKPVYVTSLNWDANESAVLAANRTISAAQVQADMLTRASISLMGLDVVPLVFWSADVSPQTPIANSLGNLSSQLDNAKAIGQIQGTQGTVEEYRFQKGSNLKVFIWHTVDGDNGIPVTIGSLPASSYIAYATDTLVLNNTTGVAIKVADDDTTVVGLNERPVLLLGKIGDVGEQIKGSIADQLDMWRIQLGELLKHWLNEAKTSLIQMFEELFDKAKENAIEWGEEQINDLLN
jgi:hypothetical protein